MSENDFELLKELVSDIDTLRKIQRENEDLETSVALYPLISGTDLASFSEETKSKLDQIAAAARMAVNAAIEEEINFKMLDIQQLNRTNHE